MFKKMVEKEQDLASQLKTNETHMTIVMSDIEYR